MCEVLIVIFTKRGEQKKYFLFFSWLESFYALLTTLSSHWLFEILFFYHLFPHCSGCDRFAEAQWHPVATLRLLCILFSGSSATICKMYVGYLLQGGTDDLISISSAEFMTFTLSAHMGSPDSILQNMIKQAGLSLCSEVLPLSEEQRLHSKGHFIGKYLSIIVQLP